MINDNVNIVLIGMSGCGKTTIGKMLSDKLNRKFVDIDEYIEETEGKTISEIFKNGEDFFRNIESKAVVQLSKIGGTIISTGGGVIKIQDNMKELSDKGIIFFIDRPIEKIAGDIDESNRPLIKNNKNYLYDLHKERYPLYKKYSDYIVVNDSTEEDLLKSIIDILLVYNGEK